MNDIREIPLGVTNPDGGHKRALTILGVLFLIGVIGLGVALAGKPDGTTWAFITANFIFVLGISQFGVVFSAIMRICGAKWPRVLYRVGEVATLAFFPLAILIFCLIYFLGRHELFYWLSDSHHEHLSPWLNSSFLFFRNLIAQLVFYGVAAAYFITGLLPDLKPDAADTGPSSRRKLYQWLLWLKAGKDPERLKRAVYYFSPVVILTAAIAGTFIAWDFGMMLVPHYHSTVFTMYFMMGNLFAGTAFMLLLFVLLSKVTDVDDYFGTVHLKNLGIMLTGFALLWLYFFWAQFFVTWYGNLPHETEPLWRQMHGHYAPFFWLMIACIILIPIGTLIFAKVKRTLWPMVAIAIMMNVGVWLNRYLIVVPALAEDHVPFASLTELPVAVGILAGFLLLAVWLFNMFPMVSMWELRDAAEDTPHP